MAERDRPIPETKKAADPQSLIPRLLTAQEVADMLRCSPAHVYDLLTRGELIEFRDGRRRLVVADSLTKMFEQNTSSPKPQAEPLPAAPKPSYRPVVRDGFALPLPRHLPKGFQTRS